MTREIELTQGKVALVDDEDYPELSQYNWHALKQHNIWYAKRNVGVDENLDGGLIAMHRIILDAQPGQEVDHKNRDGLDNRRDNLRFCTPSENSANAKKRSNTTSKYKGVYWQKLAQKWHASIGMNGNRHYLGLFEKEEDAARAYNEAARELFGEFARLNEIED